MSIRYYFKVERTRKLDGKLTEKVDQNEYGYYELQDTYRKSMYEFYEEEYYQNDYALYQKKEYDGVDLNYRDNVFRQKIAVLEKWGEYSSKPQSFLDIGCGEGYALAFFRKEGWDVCGIDLSSYGLKTHNPEMESYLRKGDFSKVIKSLSDEDKKFDFINADNVLEHLPNPRAFISSITKIMTEEAVVCITVPNDFSIIQGLAFKMNQINKAFWVTDETSEHFNYFSEQSLTRFFEAAGFKKIVAIADWPIDFFLLNPASNYQKNGCIGHDCHVACVTLENEVFKKSMEKTLELHRSLAELGLGRQICVFFRKEKNQK